MLNLFVHPYATFPLENTHEVVADRRLQPVGTGRSDRADRMAAAERPQSLAHGDVSQLPATRMGPHYRPAAVAARGTGLPADAAQRRSPRLARNRPSSTDHYLRGHSIYAANPPRD